MWEAVASVAAQVLAAAELEHQQGLYNALLGQQQAIAQQQWSDLQNNAALQQYNQLGAQSQLANYQGDYRTAHELRAMMQQRAARIDALYGWATVYPQMAFSGVGGYDPVAAKKAEKLLLDQLDESQRKEYADKQQFKVKSCNGKTYTITKKRSFNVTGPNGECYCGQTPDTPIEDQMLAQKLLLEHDPEALFKNSNKVGADGRVHDNGIGNRLAGILGIAW